jgi:hypothetical protein
MAICRQMTELFPGILNPPFGGIDAAGAKASSRRPSFESGREPPDICRHRKLWTWTSPNNMPGTRRVQKLIDKDPKLAQPWARARSIWQQDFTPAEADLLATI